MRQKVREIIYGHHRKILPIIGKYIKNKKLLDVGCGNGINSYFFKQKFNSNITLLDIKDIREKEAMNFPFFKASADDMPFKNKSFDVVFVQYVLHHLPSKLKIDNVIKELKRVAKSNIIVVEELFTNKTDKQKAREYDLKMNKILHPSTIMMINNHYTDEELKKEFKKDNLKIIQENIISKGCKEDGFLQRKLYILRPAYN